MSRHDPSIPTKSPLRRWAPLVIAVAAMVALGAMVADLTFDPSDDARDNLEMNAG